MKSHSWPGVKIFKDILCKVLFFWNHGKVTLKKIFWGTLSKTFVNFQSSQRMRVTLFHFFMFSTNQFNLKLPEFLLILCENILSAFIWCGNSQGSQSIFILASI